MIFSVHFYYNKSNSRKQSSKFEGIIFAINESRVKELINEMLCDLPIDIESISIVGPNLTLKEIYAERPELEGINPEEGYVYSRQYHLNNFRKYAGLK